MVGVVQVTDDRPQFFTRWGLGLIDDDLRPVDKTVLLACLDLNPQQRCVDQRAGDRRYCHRWKCAEVGRLHHQGRSGLASFTLGRDRYEVAVPHGVHPIVSDTTVHASLSPRPSASRMSLACRAHSCAEPGARVSGI